MSKKKRAAAKDTPRDSKGAGTQAGGAPAAWWPASFAPLHQVRMIGAGFLLFSLLLFSVANQNGLLWMKRLMAAAAGLSQPYLEYNTQCWDIAVVLWAFALILSAGWIHPILGVAALLLVRTPLDGYTYPTDNYYFVWALGLLGLFWALRSLRREQPLVLKPSFGILVLFFLVALVLSPATIESDHTYRSLILWAAYLLLLWLVVQFTTDRHALPWLVGAIVLAGVVQAVYSILHFEYLLPYLRHMLMNSREARISFFGHDEFSPELIRRFNMNRAFGSMLFPNSLAGFLILSIPLAAALAIQAILEFRRSRSMGTARPAAPEAPPYLALAWAACCWFVSALTLFGMTQFRVAYALEPLRWFEHDLALSLASCALAVAPAAFVFVVITRWGAGYAWRFFAALGLPLITVIELWTLWITYSRGAMLALLAAAMFAAVLAGLRLTRWGGGSLARAGTAFFLLGCGAHMLLQGGQYARAQEPAPAVPDGAPAAETSPDAPAEAPAPPPVANQRLREEGVDISAAELMNPESFRLRLSYWNVGLKMFLNHLWTGVGLGNFGIAYPIYQYVGAGDTKEAHSGFLQFFCETGIAGGLMFCVFWAIFLLAGALDLLRTPAGGGLLLKLGLYTGLLAFLLHAGIDIHFSHPSLVMFAVTFAALFMAGSGSTLFVLGPGKTKSLAVAVLMLMLVFNLVIAVFTLRPYLQDLGMSRTNLINVAGNQNQTKRLAAAELFLVQTPDYARSPEGKNAPQIAFQAAHTLIPDAEALAALGTLYTPLETGQGYRPLNPGEDPVNSVLMIQRPRDAYAKALESTQKRVAELEAVDACYGRSPELALHIAQWCKLITDRTNNAKYERIRKKYLDRMVEWGQQAVERNPMSAETHSFLGHLLWHHVNLDLGPGRMDKVRAAVTHFRRATELNPSVPDLKDQYARVLRELANTPSRELSDPEKAEYRRQADAVQLEADALRKHRAELGLP